MDNIFDSVSFDSKKPKWNFSHTHKHSLVVGHVSGGGAELGVGLDDLVDGLQEVLLCGDLPASSDGEHAGLCAHAADLSTWQENTQHQILLTERLSGSVSHVSVNTLWF